MCKCGTRKIFIFLDEDLGGAWEGIFFYDTVLFALTFLRTWKAHKYHAVTGINIPMVSLIFGDGSSLLISFFSVQVLYLTGYLFCVSHPSFGSNKLWLNIPCKCDDYE